MRASVTWVPELSAYGRDGTGSAPAVLPRVPKPLIALLQRRGESIARAGAPSPFSTLSGRQKSS